MLTLKRLAVLTPPRVTDLTLLSRIPAALEVLVSVVSVAAMSAVLVAVNHQKDQGQRGSASSAPLEWQALGVSSGWSLAIAASRT